MKFILLVQESKIRKVKPLMSRSLLTEGYQQDQAFPDTTTLSGLSKQETLTKLRQEG